VIERENEREVERQKNGEMQIISAVISSPTLTGLTSGCRDRPAPLIKDTHTHTHTHTHTTKNTHTHTHTHTHTYIRTHMLFHTHAHICTHTHALSCTHTHTYSLICDRVSH